LVTSVTRSPASRASARRSAAAASPARCRSDEERERRACRPPPRVDRSRPSGVGEQAADPLALEPALGIRIVAARVRARSASKRAKSTGVIAEAAAALQPRRRLVSLARKPSRQVRTKVRKRAFAGS
jgi:hypothetical protein